MTVFHCSIEVIISQRNITTNTFSYHMSTGLSSSPWHLIRDLLCLGNKKGWCDAMARIRWITSDVYELECEFVVMHHCSFIWYNTTLHVYGLFYIGWNTKAEKHVYVQALFLSY